MLRRTIPSVSFTASHRALAMRTNRPLLGSEMNSVERFKAAWDDLPMTSINMSCAEQFSWFMKWRLQLGIRDIYKTTKAKWALKWFTTVLTVGIIWPASYLNAFLRFPLFGPSEDMSKEKSLQLARAYGYDVWAGDGKFLRPYFHINPPLLTMTTEDL